MSVALRGNLRDFGIADVFQLIGQQRKTGVLEFTGDEGRQVQLRFDRGAVVAAAPLGADAGDALADMLVRCGRLTREQVSALVPECRASAQTVARLAIQRGWIDAKEVDRIEDLLTRETFFELLRWESGAFDFRAEKVDHARRFESLLGAEQMLMDGLRMVDEWHSFSEFVPSEDTVFQRAAGLEEFRRRSGLSPDQREAAERIYALVDGRIPARRIVDLSLLGTFDAMRMLAELRRAQVIEPLDDDAVRRLQSLPVRRLLMDRAEAASWIAGLVPLLLLGALLVFSPGGAAPPAPRFALERAPVEGLRSAYATLRARHALEAHRFAEGRWPERLEELEGNSLLAQGALTPSGGRPYYYVQRESGALLLAPER